MQRPVYIGRRQLQTTMASSILAAVPSVKLDPRVAQKRVGATCWRIWASAPKGRIEGVNDDMVSYKLLPVS